MASTSWVRLLSAMTEGSFRTMPSPRAYTNVLAVPRSIARSRARTGPLALGRLRTRARGGSWRGSWRRARRRRRGGHRCIAGQHGFDLGLLGVVAPQHDPALGFV